LYKRVVAKPVFIAELLAGSFLKGRQKYEPGFVDAFGEALSRVSIVATVLSKNLAEGRSKTGGKDVMMQLYDGTGAINARCAIGSKTRGITVGDAVFVIGKVKELERRYLFIEAIRRSADDNEGSAHAFRVALRKKTALSSESG
jgi:RPA family protein